MRVSGRWAREIGRILTNLGWALLPLDASVAEDAAMKALVNSARAPFLVANPNMTVPMFGMTLKLTTPISTVLGQVNAPLDREHALESSFSNAWTDALRPCHPSVNYVDMPGCSGLAHP